jgi:uncharacterized alpha-E superfamily protein
MTIREVLKRPVSENGLPDILAIIRRQNALVRGAVTGTMMQNDVYNFAHLGIFIERADNTARILDVKYYVLLPSVSYVGSSLDNVQWETILRSVSAQRAYRWLSDGTANPRQIANLTDYSDLATFRIAADPDAPSGVNSIRVTGSLSTGATQIFIQYHPRYSAL